MAWGVAALGMALSTVGCTQTGSESDAGRGFDTGARDTGADAPATRCTSDPECDDDIECTIDSCVVGNVCEHAPLDELCPSGERCIVGDGCRAGMPDDCVTSDDCDDGSYCNGVETCVGPEGSRVCVRGMDVDCDDGNACTLDRCEEAEDGCRYATAPGCDAGVVPTDAGVPCDAFDASTDYVGTFRMVPGQAQSCGDAMYRVSDLVFSISGSTLSVRADGFVLTQTPVPTDGTFDVSATVGCGTYRVSGSFECADRFTGRWLATFSGCAFCTRQDAMIGGFRR